MEPTYSESIVARLARMEEKLDNHLQRTTAIENRLESHDERLRAVETSGAKVYGIGAIVALLASIFGSSLLGLIH